MKSNKIQYSRKIRILGAIALALTFAAQLNYSYFKLEILNLEPRVVSTLMYWVLGMFAIWAIQRRT